MSRLKRALFRAADMVGVSSALRDSRWRRSRLLILCYHGISLCDEHLAAPGLYVTQELFRHRLRRVREGGYNVVSLDSGIRQLYEGTLPSRAVAITFDDGTRDFAEKAVPVLREFGMHATLYLTTFYCEHPYPVFDTALHYLLWRGRVSGVDVAGVIGSAVPLPLQAGDARTRARQAIYDYASAQNMDAERKQLLLRSIAERLGVDWDDFMASGMFQQMAPEQIAALPRDIVDIQLHTHRHRTPRNEALFRRELVDNREAIGRLWDRAPREHFCYPSGEYWGEFLPWLRALGVRSATTTVPGIASSEMDPLLLPRFLDATYLPDHIFDAWLTGLAELIPRRRANRMLRERLAPRKAG